MLGAMGKVKIRILDKLENPMVTVYTVVLKFPRYMLK
jgi:hypothetical protein